jgi:t-SNARE complex subunit (syntaxin)
MATDRLMELNQLSGGGVGAVAIVGSDVESGNIGDGGANFMQDFFGQVAGVKKQMEMVNTNIRELEEMQNKAITDVYGGQEFKQGIEEKSDDTNLLCQQVRTALKNMDADLKGKVQYDPSIEQSSDFKIRKNMLATLTKKFTDTMGRYQDCQAKYKERCQATVERQYRIVKPDATQAEIDQVMEGGGGDSIFTEHMLASKNAQARAALEDVKEKHADIQKLEKSIEELHQLFVDLSVLVESQGELLDTIEYSVSQSLSYTKTGVQELEKANEYARKSRKKMCILIAILLVVVLVVLGPILHSVLG